MHREFTPELVRNVLDAIYQIISEDSIGMISDSQINRFHIIHCSIKYGGKINVTYSLVFYSYSDLCLIFAEMLNK